MQTIVFILYSTAAWRKRVNIKPNRQHGKILININQFCFFEISRPPWKSLIVYQGWSRDRTNAERSEFQQCQTCVWSSRHLLWISTPLLLAAIWAVCYILLDNQLLKRSPSSTGLPTSWKINKGHLVGRAGRPDCLHSDWCGDLCKRVWVSVFFSTYLTHTWIYF